MKKTVEIFRDAIISAGILFVCFVLCYAINNIFERNALIPSVFVLGVFLVSVTTHGYLYGTMAAIVSVLAVNFAFTVPFYAFDFTIPDNIISSIILFVVAIITCTSRQRLKVRNQSTQRVKRKE